jgi:hypothetical protein
MIKITNDQKIAINEVGRATEAQRKAITCYKANNKLLALFRMQAGSAVRDITIHHTTKQKLPKDSRDFLRVWLADRAGGFGDLVLAFVTALETATGRTVVYSTPSKKAAAPEA